MCIQAGLLDEMLNIATNTSWKTGLLHLGFHLTFHYFFNLSHSLLENFGLKDIWCALLVGDFDHRV